MLRCCVGDDLCGRLFCVLSSALVTVVVVVLVVTVAVVPSGDIDSDSGDFDSLDDCGDACRLGGVVDPGASTAVDVDESVELGLYSTVCWSLSVLARNILEKSDALIFEGGDEGGDDHVFLEADASALESFLGDSDLWLATDGELRAAFFLEAVVSDISPEE